jgi:hypothetical protein
MLYPKRRERGRFIGAEFNDIKSVVEIQTVENKTVFIFLDHIKVIYEYPAPEDFSTYHYKITYGEGEGYWAEVDEINLKKVLEAIDLRDGR